MPQTEQVTYWQAGSPEQPLWNIGSPKAGILAGAYSAPAAQLIVTALNSHDALVAALERASNWFERDMVLPRGELAEDYSGMGLELRAALRLGGEDQSSARVA